MTRVFVTGSASGQLHWELFRTKPDSIVWLSWPSRLDIRNRAEVGAAVQQLQPDVIINAAAYTAVDDAESQPQLAYDVNHRGVENLALAARDARAKLVHVSTDFVFGESCGQPFLPDAAVNPVSVYGKSKLAGENALLTILQDDSMVIRTAWLYSSHGNNFVKTMIRLMNERDQLGVVADQVGSPTWAYSLAGAIWRSLSRDLQGVFHWTGAGVASWYDFAVAIAEEAMALNLIDTAPAIKPLTTDQYPTPALRPAYSVLALADSWQRMQIDANHWRVDLRQMLQEL
jgi:dTDP-4-dehydrorhamnose reductase